MADFYLRVGDTLPALLCGLVDGNGAAIDLTSATSVSFRMELAGAVAPKVNAGASITNPTQGQVSYAWQAADVNAPGLYYAAWVITWPGGQQTIPSGSALEILVSPA